MSIRPVSIVFALAFASLAVAQASTTAASSITPTHAPFQLHLSTGGIVAVTMGSTLGVLLIVIASYFCCCHAACMHARKLKRTQGQMDTKQSVRGCTCKEAKYDAERGIAKDVDVRLDGDVHSTAHIKTQGEEEPGYVRRSLDKKDYDEADEGHGAAMEQRVPMPIAHGGVFAHGGTADEDVRSMTSDPPKYEDS